MKILQEVKKIFDKKVLILLITLGGIFYILFFRNNVGIPSYSSEKVNIEVSKVLKAEYGNTIQEDEILRLKNNPIFTKKNKIDVWIKENENFQKYGINSYQDLINKQDLLSDDIASYLISQVSEHFTAEEQQEALDNVWAEEYMDSLVKAYDTEILSNKGTSYYSKNTGYDQKRIQERKQEEIYSIMPDNVMKDYLTILPDFAIFVFLSVILLVVPYSVKDTLDGVNMLQYASKIGKKYYWIKVAAAFISSIILCIIESAFFIIVLYKNDAIYFADCFVSGFRNPFITLLKVTFGEYTILSMVYISFIAVCLAMIAYCLSSYVYNYISAIALQIPLVVISIAISLLIMPHFAEITQNGMMLFLIPIVYCIVMIILNAIRFVSIRFYEKI